MRPVLDPSYLDLYPNASRERPELGDFVKLLVFVQVPTAVGPKQVYARTVGAWYRVTGRCGDGRYRGRGASPSVGNLDEVRFSPEQVIERRRPDTWKGKLAAWIFKRSATPC